MWVQVMKVHFTQSETCMLKCGFSLASYLDALFKLVPRGGRALAEKLAEDDYLLKEEDPALLAAGQDAGVLLRHKESLLLQQLALAGQLPLPHQTTHG